VLARKVKEKKRALKALQNFEVKEIQNERQRHDAFMFMPKATILCEIYLYYLYHISSMAVEALCVRHLAVG
jgi:hypothetical protein